MKMRKQYIKICETQQKQHLRGHIALNTVRSEGPEMNDLKF